MLDRESTAQRPGDGTEEGLGIEQDRPASVERGHELPSSPFLADWLELHAGRAA